MPPFYDLECGNCNYEKDDVYFASHKAFQEADKTCPDCGDTLEKKLPKFNVGGKKSSSSHKPCIKLDIVLGLIIPQPGPMKDLCKKKKKSRYEQIKKPSLN